jgi:hypothetical protein
MIILGSFEFQLQMHPIHKVFGAIMSVAGCLHVSLNYRSVMKYLNDKKILVSGVFLSLFMIFLCVVGLNKPLNLEAVNSIEKSMSQLESKE